MEGDQYHNPDKADLINGELQKTQSNEDHESASSTESSGELEPP